MHGRPFNAVDPGHSLRSRLFLALGIGWGIAVLSSWGDMPTPRSTHITLAEDWTLVREVYEVRISATSEVIRLPLPSSADPASITFPLAGQLPPRIESWRPVWTGDTDAVAPSPTGWIDLGDSLRDPVSHVSHLHAVDVTVVGSRPGTYRMTLAYRLSGWPRQVAYFTSVRGDLADPDGPMAVDIEGWLTVENPTSRAFDQVTLLLVAGDVPADPAQQEHHRGILELDPDSPLADLWRRPPAINRVQRTYAVGEGIRLAAGETTAIPLAAITRRPARRLYSLEAESIPTDVRGPGAPFLQTLIVRNDQALSQGRSLPPGRSMIYQGTQRTALIREGNVGHIPADGEMRMMIGPVLELRATRISKERIPSAAGFIEATWEVRIQNEQNKAYPIELLERPPINLAWTISRANRVYDLVDRTLIFAAEIGPRARMTIDYTLRIRQPEFFQTTAP